MGVRSSFHAGVRLPREQSRAATHRAMENSSTHGGPVNAGRKGSVVTDAKRADVFCACDRAHWDAKLVLNGPRPYMDVVDETAVRRRARARDFANIW